MCALSVVPSVCSEKSANGEEFDRAYEYWKSVQPVDTTPASSEVVEFVQTVHFLREPGLKRRDPSDIIRVGDTYYVWYGIVSEDTPGYPGGWCATIWL